VVESAQKDFGEEGQEMCDLIRPAAAETYIFYHQAWCCECRTTTRISVHKRLDEIPSTFRTQALDLLTKGVQPLWPVDPSEAEIDELLAHAACPNAHKNPELMPCFHRLHFVSATIDV
jgi:hypothetical protein